MNQFPMTMRGAEALKEELHELKTVKRPRIVNDIAEAREHGDLKENAEYHAAREEQGFCEGRIQEIEGKLSYAQIIDVTTIAESDKVIFGATVDILNVDTDETVTYQIVGDDEADVKAGKISYSSPIARGLIGKEVGDKVEQDLKTVRNELALLRARPVTVAETTGATRPDEVSTSPQVEETPEPVAEAEELTGDREGGVIRAAPGGAVMVLDHAELVVLAG